MPASEDTPRVIGRQPQGLKGDKGDKGESGDQGKKGERGEAGPPGPVGWKGEGPLGQSAGEGMAASHLEEVIKEAGQSVPVCELAIGFS
jgi:hypothetical protein